MICQQCGYCCISAMVVIVDDLSKGLKEGNIVLKESNKRCKHLRGSEPGDFSCAAHHYRWYKRTPCFSHGQIEQGNTYCRMGVYVLNNNRDLIKQLLLQGD